VGRKRRQAKMVIPVRRIGISEKEKKPLDPHIEGFRRPSATIRATNKPGQKADEVVRKKSRPRVKENWGGSSAEGRIPTREHAQEFGEVNGHVQDLASSRETNWGKS